MTAIQPHEQCQLLTLAGIDARNAHAERRVLAPFDTIDLLASPSRTSVVSRRRWRRLCRALLAGQLPAGGLRTAAGAGMDLLPHQLEPALAVLEGRGCRIMLADEVGLGKTIQAGLLLAELTAAGAVERALILTPAGLRDQWAHELAGRFGLSTVVVDMPGLRRRASELPPAQNPWTTLPVAIASLDYVKRPEVLPGLAGTRWDLVLVDEAHSVSEGTDRFEAVHALCRLAPYVVLLTATPHNGDPNAFLALCGLGAHRSSPRRPSQQRDERSGAASDGVEPILVFRRRRSDLSLAVKRRVHHVLTRPSGPEQRLHTLLDRFVRAVRRQRGSTDADIRLALTVLRKRALSSASSLAATVERRLSTLSTGNAPAARQLFLPLEDAGELDASDEAPLVAVPLLDDPDEERRLLLGLSDAALEAARSETKLARLKRLLGALLRKGEAVLVFTEYRDTLMHVVSQLPCRCAVLHGGLARHERRAALEAFACGSHDVLLATDAAGEGLNLQARCRTVINLELPWNPNRLEQRIGRVDRISQRHTVHVFHLIAGGTPEVSLLSRLRQRVALAKADFDAADPFAPSVETGGRRHGEEVQPREVEDADRGGSAWQVTRMPEQAAVERTRLLQVRALACADAGGNGALRGAVGGPFVRIARHRTRLLLDGQILVLIQAVCENACGTPIAGRIVSLLIRPHAPVPIGDLAHVVSTARAASQTSIVPPLAEWQARTRDVHRRFWEARHLRDEGIARTLDSLQPDAFQAGLFDHRAEREQADDLLRRHTLRSAAALRLASAGRLATFDGIHTRYVLVLVPAHLLSK